MDGSWIAFNQDGRVMVESSDKTWSTGEGNDFFTSCYVERKTS